uniref:Uncharacterized protein n=1 Tax=Anguilla anguilla TaxID=7936 RepID=A0A0E9WXA9_ANGAN
MWVETRTHRTWRIPLLPDAQLCCFDSGAFVIRSQALLASLLKGDWTAHGRETARQPCWDSSGDKGQAKHPTAVRLTGLDSTDYLIRKLFSAQTQLNSHQNESPKLFL